MALAECPGLNVGVGNELGTLEAGVKVVAVAFKCAVVCVTFCAKPGCWGLGVGVGGAKREGSTVAKPGCCGLAGGGREIVGRNEFCGVGRETFAIAGTGAWCARS